MNRYRLEFWADSFHEGFWACEELSKYFKHKSTVYRNNFIPVVLYALGPDVELEVTVLGSYRNWTPLPKIIDNLLDWGKPDLIIYDPSQQRILFSLEETAAVPTGNQALQRCERMYGSSRLKIPFWYLLGEFGIHIDEGVRRDSIWPSILAIKLSCIYHSPCLVLHYSDVEHPEDYGFGTGKSMLFEVLAMEIEVHLGLKQETDLLPLLTKQYKLMLEFVDSQWSNIVDYLPQQQLLSDGETCKDIASLATSENHSVVSLKDLFNWGKTETLPKEFYDGLKPGGVIKKDIFVGGVEDLVKAKRAYNLSSNAGSRPQKRSDIVGWIQQQKKLFNSNKLGNASFSINIDDFPISRTGLYHMTTAKNVFYLIDSLDDMSSVIQQSFIRLSTLNIKHAEPVFLYVCNSLKPGRIFGDPFTGQLSAFANIFAKNLLGERTRVAIAYYPHQVYTQLFDLDMKFRKNKGITIMRELLDYAIFNGGILVNFKTGEIL